MDNDTSKRVTQAELARHLNVSRAAVHKAIQSGRITAGADGLFDLEQAVQDWKNNTRAAVSAAKRAAQPKQPRGGQPKYASARARKEHHMANLAEMREARARGELCRVDDVRQAGAEAGTLLRLKLKSLSVSLAGRLVGMQHEQMVAILDDAFDDVLIELADAMEKAAGTISEPPEMPI